MGQTTSSSVDNSVTVDPSTDIINQNVEENSSPNDDDAIQGPFVQVLYGTKTKNGMNLAYKLSQRYAIKHSPLPINVTPIDQFEPEDLNKLEYLIIIMSTHENGTPAPDAKLFMDWLQDVSQDFRYGKGWLTKLNFSVVGLGSSDYKRNYNVVAKDVKVQLKALGANLFARPCILDYSDSVDKDPEEMFEQWCLHTLLPAVNKDIEQQKHRTAEKEAIAKQLEERKKALANDVDPDYFTDSEVEDSEDYSEEEDMVDVEDMGTEMDPVDIEQAKKPRKMLSDKQHRALTKQGYRIVGSHSGVKTCRWTKAAIRGFGLCYKNALYGIQSHQCMEMTPSLACANKCTFCWRHHTNPVGREWKWEMDQPEMIIDGAISNHIKMIEIFKGTPGLRQDRYQQALTPKHCALSLVGEPIMYPEINKFVDYLHGNDISTFLVTNAQFPNQLRHLSPVTQLYLSIDAHSPETLKAIDRPLNEDFWERFIECQKILSEKKQRTVYRLTLVKGFNMDEAIQGYAKLIAIGQPTFVEVKGVTFSGPDGGLTMKNVPYHDEVKKFCELLSQELNKNSAENSAMSTYELAGEHAHSCCVLLSDTRMKRDGKWFTWIDYPKFQELYKKWKETGEEFTDEDYSVETPAWAAYGSPEAGFSPDDVRHTARGKNRTNLNAKIAESQQKLAAQGIAVNPGFVAPVQGIGGCCSQTKEENAAHDGCCKTQKKPEKHSEGCCSEEKKSEQGCCGGKMKETNEDSCKTQPSRECCQAEVPSVVEKKNDECCGNGDCCKE